MESGLTQEDEALGLSPTVLPRPAVSGPPFCGSSPNPSPAIPFHRYDNVPPVSQGPATAPFSAIAPRAPVRASPALPDVHLKHSRFFRSLILYSNVSPGIREGQSSVFGGEKKEGPRW